MNIYVYRLDDTKYGAGLIKEVCERRGKIVEVWPIDTPAQIDYVKRHGTARKTAYDRVKLLAERAENKLTSPNQQDYDEHRESFMIELYGRSWRERLRFGMKLIFGRF